MSLSHLCGKQVIKGTTVKPARPNGLEVLARLALNTNKKSLSLSLSLGKRSGTKDGGGASTVPFSDKSIADTFRLGRRDGRVENCGISLYYFLLCLNAPSRTNRRAH